jgi:hypothetical protein
MKFNLFLILGGLSFTAQLFVLLNLKTQIQNSKIDKQMTIFNYFNYYTPLIFVSLFLVLIFEIYFNNYYHAVLLILLLSFAASFSLVVLANISKLFLKWYHVERNKLLLIYSLAFISIALNILFSFCISITFLSNKPSEVRFSFGIVTPHFYSNTIELLNIGNSLSSVCGFVLAWIGTLLMLNQYSIRLSKKVHWVIVSIPMMYFSIQFTPILLDLILRVFQLSPILYGIFYTLLVSFSQPVGGLIFGGAFFALTKNLSMKGIKFEYPKISGFGFILLFMTNQLIILSPANYPPFSFITISMLPFACFMVFLGIYSSALSISFDNRLKDDIKRLVANRSNLLLSISTSEGILLMENGINDIYKKISNETSNQGINTMITFEEAKAYLIEELESLQTMKNQGREGDPKNNENRD